MPYYWSKTQPNVLIKSPYKNSSISLKNTMYEFKITLSKFYYRPMKCVWFYGIAGLVVHGALNVSVLPLMPRCYVDSVLIAVKMRVSSRWCESRLQAPWCNLNTFFFFYFQRNISHTIPLLIFFLIILNYHPFIFILFFLNPHSFQFA